MALNSQQVAEMIAMAKAQRCFFMEGLWTRFHPNILKTEELIRKGKLGEVNYLRADFGFAAPFDPNNRIYNMDLGGGALLDIGIYPLFLAQLIFGKPNRIQSMGVLSPLGGDTVCNVQLGYEGGKMAHIHSTVITDTNIEAEVYGSKARLKLYNRWHHPNPVSLFDREELLERHEFPKTPGFTYQIRHVHKCLQQGLTESPLMPFTFSIFR